MMRLNNKGQSLILFIIFLPVLLGIMALVIDVGNALSKKHEQDNVIELVLNYGLKNSEVFYSNNDEYYYNEELINWKDDLKILLDYNLKTSENGLNLEDKKINIQSETYVEGIFSNILNIKGFKIESEYVGYIENDEKIVKKIK